ncbi:MAG: hypothetical protein Q9169_002408 [Polycauliona sp. 2 TL-2023]
MLSISKSAVLVTLFLFFTSISSLTPEIPSRRIADILLNRPNLRGIPIPDGYSVHIIQDPQKPLNVNDLYFCAIEATYHWSSLPWNEELQDQSGRSAIVRGLQISYHGIPNRPIGIYGKHFILAILHSLNTMDKRHDFTEAVVEMRQFDSVFGVVKIEKPANTTNGIAPATITKRDDDADSVKFNDTAAAPVIEATNNNPPTSKTIFISDIQDWGTANITYQRLGARVPCQLLFSTALDAIAFAATDDWGDTWPLSTATDWSDRMMFQTVEVEFGEGGSMWVASYIAMVARLVPERLFEEDDCGEFRFRMELEGNGRVGTGSCQVLDFARQRAKGARPPFNSLM